MDSAVISDNLGELLDNREVKAAVFTTYTFEPEFFELEVIPLLLPGSTPFSSDSRVKEFQVREALRDTRLSLDVFYDMQIFRREGQRSPSMEYMCYGIHGGNSAFHAKLTLILAYDRNYETECLLVGAGSNNLTRAGWWDNIECQHWEVIWPGETQRAFLNRLRDDIFFLRNEQRIETKRNSSALATIEEFLKNCPGSNQAPPVGYYGISHLKNVGSFKKFLRQQAKSQWSFRNWTLEIISPFFAEDPKNKEHEFFFDLGIEKIHMFLPMDQDGKALCHPDYYRHVDKLEGVDWAEWSGSANKKLNQSKQNYRRLHAKVYHFYNQRQSWVFVGSVNFSYKAMMENNEAGFFVKLPSSSPMLQRLRSPKDIDFPSDLPELPPELTPQTEPEGMPQIYLAYDWMEKSLSGATIQGQNYSIDILTPEGGVAISAWAISDTECVYEGPLERLESLLKNGSLVRIDGFDIQTSIAFPTHTVMLQQTGWSHKPLDTYDLAPEQILAIYADMTPERRQLLLMHAQIKKLVLDGIAGEMTSLAEDLEVDQFFSEYAEIFHAFRRLKQRLSEALDVNNHPLVDYYLTGKGMDSLPTLIECATETENTVKPVTAYLLLLCAREIYQEPNFLKQPLIEHQLREVEMHLGDLKTSGRIQLENTTPTGQTKFFKWFEDQFSKDYVSNEALL